MLFVILIILKTLYKYIESVVLNLLYLGVYIWKELIFVLSLNNENLYQ